MSSNILLNVLDIYLDTENPRHNPINDQSKIIEHLLEGDGVKSLARHISLNGINPLDSMGVIKDEEGNYVVVEGNRRLCSLLLLNDPDKAPSSDVSYFRRLADNSNIIPNSINCVLFDSQEEAYIWMGVRHNGEQDGVGIKRWDSKQRTRHNSRTNKKDQNALALAIIDYAVEQNILHVSNTERIITTAARYLGNPFFRETIGIVSSRSEQDVVINVSCTAFNKVLARFCEDLVNNTVVHSRTRREEWIEYAKMLIEMGIAPKEKVAPQLIQDCLAKSTTQEPENKGTNSEPTKLDDGNQGTQSGTPTPTEGGKADLKPDNGISGQGGSNGDTGKIKTDTNSKNPDLRKFIIPHDFKVNINNKILRRAFTELKTIEIDDCPLAVSQVTRAFLENLYILFHESVTGSNSPQQTHILMGKVIAEIELNQDLTKGEKNAVAALKRVQSNEMNVLSPKTLGANAHAGIYPDPIQLKREFDNISDAIKYMLKRI